MRRTSYARAILENGCSRWLSPVALAALNALSAFAFETRVHPVAGDATAVLQAAIDECAHNGGGRVFVESGIYDIRTIRLLSRVELHLGRNAVLRGSRNPDEYSGLFPDWGGLPMATNRWSNAMIRVLGGRDVSIVGEPGSEIDGRNCYDEKGEEGFRGPHAISAYSVTNFVLKGFLVRDAGNFGLYAHGATNVTVSRLDIRGGHDGLDFFSSSDIAIAGCVIHSGDDCVAGYNNRRLSVQDCDLNTSCSVFRLGGNEILIADCRAESPGEYAHRWFLSPTDKRLERAPKGAGRHNTLSCFTFFTGKSSKSDSSNIVFRNCRFDGIERLMHYNLSGNERWQKGKGLCDVTFENVDAAGLLYPLVAYGVEQTPLHLAFHGGRIGFRQQVESLICGANVGCVELRDVTVSGVKSSLMDKWQEMTPAVKIEGVKGLPEKVRPATGRFSCRPI